MHEWNAGELSHQTMAARAWAWNCPASASDASDVDAVIQKWVSDFNKGDTTAAIAACAPDAVVIDGFPPYA